MLAKAIQKRGHPIVLSLSPGPVLIDKAWHYEKCANMWRITDDLWDDWDMVKNMFFRCELWQNHVSEGCYPDCDTLPLGIIGKGFGDELESVTAALSLQDLWTGELLSPENSIIKASLPVHGCVLYRIL